MFCFLNFCTKKILIFSQFSFFQSLSTLVSCSWVKVARAWDIGRLFVFGGVLTSNVIDLHRQTYLCSWSLEAGIFHSCFLLNQTAKHIKHSVQGILRYMESTLESEKKKIVGCLKCTCADNLQRYFCSSPITLVKGHLETWVLKGLGKEPYSQLPKLSRFSNTTLS